MAPKHPHDWRRDVYAFHAPVFFAYGDERRRCESEEWKGEWKGFIKDVCQMLNELYKVDFQVPANPLNANGAMDFCFKLVEHFCPNDCRELRVWGYKKGNSPPWKARKIVELTALKKKK